MAEIAVSVTIQVLKKTSDIVADLIVKEGSRFSRMQKEISWLETEMRFIQSYLKDAENKQAESEGVANFIREIRALAFEVEDTMEKYFSPSRKDKGLKGFFKNIPHIISNLNSSRNFLLEVEDIKTRVGDLNCKRQRYGINDQAGGTEREEWNDRRSYPHVEEPNIIGFENHTRDLVAKLGDEDPSLQVISIIGMSGLGKTTLAKKVYNSARGSFKLKAWVYVSEQPNFERILLDIAKQVGLGIGKWEDGDEAKLYEHLSLEKYLLVIDDIWHTRSWDAIKNAIPTYSQNGSRIILTSRNRDVGVHVGGLSSLYELNPLEENDSKQLFQSSLGIVETKDDPCGLKEIGEQILRRCRGVPLAIVVISGLLKLKERSIPDWNGVLARMHKIPEELSKTYMLSYTDLPSDLKPCFLYFGIFLEDEEIDAFDLINLWVAEGFIKGSDSREVEEVGDEYLNHLVTRNLIQVDHKDVAGKVMSYRIHDILHNLCIQVAKDINFFTISTDLTNPNFSPVRRVTDHGIRHSNDHISSNLQKSKIRSFIFFKGGYLSSQQNVKSRNIDFLEDHSLVRVVYFNEPISSTSAKKIWTLKNLTYLKLRIIDDCFEITESIIFLENLVTLDIQWDYRNRRLVFPMIIWNMKQLRHLLLPDCAKVKPTYKGFDPNAIQFRNFQTLQVPLQILKAEWLHKFFKLRKLTFTGGNEDSYIQIVQETLCSNLVLVLNKLETLQIKVPYPLQRVPVTMLKISGYQNLTNLILEWVRIEQWAQLTELPPNLTNIELCWCVLNEDPLQVMKNMPKLRALKLIYVNYGSGKLFCNGEPGNFPQLRQLYIETDMAISEITIEDGGMPKLEEFKTNVPTVKLPTSIERIWEQLRPDSLIWAEDSVSRTIEELKKTSNKVADLIAKEGSQFSRMQEEISWLETEMGHIQSYLKDVEIKQAQSEPVATLIRDIKVLARDVDIKVMRKYFYPSPKGKGLKDFLKKNPRIFSNVNSLHNFLLEVEAIKTRVGDLNRVRESYGINEQHSDDEDHTRDLVAKHDDEDPSLRVISI